MKKRLVVVALLVLTLTFPAASMAAQPQQPVIKLGDEVLMSKYHQWIDGKRVGLVTNQSGVTSTGQSMIDVLANDSRIQLTALFAPEHGLDGTASAGSYVESYTHPTLGIPVYSLYGSTRMPTQAMLANVDVLLFDVQDLGSRTYTYISTLNYCMVAAQKYGKEIIVLDRPNPVGGTTVEGPVLEDKYQSFVGVDNLPMAHGMTVAELAQYFNREIGADLKVVPMEGYKRTMVFQDTGLTWIPTSPNIPDIDSVFGYMATGLGEGTGIFQADKFKWIGGNGIDSNVFANLLNGSGLKGVTFIPEPRGNAGGVRLNITDYHTFNPARTGFYALAYAHQLNHFAVPGSGTMFEKIMGTDKIGRYLEQGLSPQQIEANYASGLSQFKQERQKYLLPEYGTASGTSGSIGVLVNGVPIAFDSPPYIDSHDRTMVPLRAITEALGAYVLWTSDDRKITITRNGQTVIFALNSRSAVVDGSTRTMDTTPVIKNSRTMVPLRYIGEFFGASVNWDPAQRIVTVDQTV